MFTYLFILCIVKLILIEKSRVEDERKVDELIQKLEEAIALRQEAEAKLAHAEKKLCELEHLPGNVKVSQFCSHHLIMINILSIFCMFMTYSTSCGHFDKLWIHGMYVCIDKLWIHGTYVCMDGHYYYHHCVPMLRSLEGCTELKTSKYHVHV